MNTYRVKVQEKISMWQDVYITVNADNGMELRKKILEFQDIQYIENGELYTETQDNLEWDLDNLEIIQIGDLEL